MRARRACLALLCLTLLCHPVVATADGHLWRTVGVRDGLLSHTVHALWSTASGGLLVGTSGGLNQWDGDRWRQYSAGNGLAEGYVTAVAELGGVVWAGSWGGGLSVLRDGDWRTYRAADSPLPCDWIADLAVSSRTLWVATYGGGLATLTGEAWAVYRRADGGLPSDWLTCVLPDGEGGAWVGSESAGLAHLRPDGPWEAVALPVAAGDAVMALSWLDGANTRELWVGTPTGVVRLAVEPGGASRTLPPTPALDGWAITALAPTGDGGMWVGTKRGLLRWDGAAAQRYTLQQGLPHEYISALAVDARGAVWVGTLTVGLATTASLPEGEVPRLPVVLVHGWRSAESDRLEDSEFRHLAGWLREDGFPVYFATGIRPENTLYQNARALCDTIDRALRASGARQVYLLAFSMGGLNARAYLESTLYRGDVARLFTLGSPHRGEDLWQTPLLWEHLDWSDEPSTLELLPEHMDVYNGTHTQPDGVPYVLIAGDAAAPGGTGELPSLFTELPPGDGLVSVWSAWGPASLVAERRLTRDLHAWAQQTQVLKLPSLLLPRSTYDAHIRPYLFGVGDAPGAGASIRPGDDLGAANTPRSVLRAGALAPGQSAVLAPIPVDAAGRMRVYIRWKGPTPEVVLRDPAGVSHGANDNDPNVEYLALDWADFVGYEVSNGDAGDWVVTLTASPKQSGPSRYIVYAEWPDTALHLRAEADASWARLGEPVTITVAVEGAADAAAHEVIGEVYAPSGARQALAFARQTAANGAPTYVAQMVPQEAGYHTVLVSMRGQRGGRAFERGASVSVTACGEGARLEQVDAPERGPEPGGRRYAPVSLVADSPGEYLVTLTLRKDSLGDPVYVAHPVRLEAGAHRVDVPLAGLASDIGGTWTLVEATLMDIAGAGVLVDVLRLAPGLEVPQ